MNKYLLLICFTYAQLSALEALPHAVFSPSHNRRSTDFKQLALVQKLDGTFFTAIDIQNAYKMIFMIYEMLNGSLDPKSKQRVGMFNVDGSQKTLKDLVILEEKYTKSKNSDLLSKIKTSLKKAKEEFTQKVRSFEKPDQAGVIAKGIQKALIEFFEQDQKINDRILRSQDNKEILTNASAREFCEFLINLKNFLEDLTKSCTVAGKEYKKLIDQAKKATKA